MDAYAGLFLSGGYLKCSSRRRHVFDLDVDARSPRTSEYDHAWALDGVGLAYQFDELTVDHVAARSLHRVLEECARPGGLLLYYPSRRQIPSALEALIAL